jgi:hypothetical protein
VIFFLFSFLSGAGYVAVWPLLAESCHGGASRQRRRPRRCVHVFASLGNQRRKSGIYSLFHDSEVYTFRFMTRSTKSP